MASQSISPSGGAGGDAAEAALVDQTIAIHIGNMEVQDFFIKVQNRQVADLVPLPLHPDWRGVFGAGCHAVSNILINFETENTMDLPQFRTMVVNTPPAAQNKNTVTRHMDGSALQDGAVVIHYRALDFDGKVRATGVVVHKIGWTDEIMTDKNWEDQDAGGSGGAESLFTPHSHDNGITYLEGEFRSQGEAQAACKKRGFQRSCVKTEAIPNTHQSGFSKCAVGWFLAESRPGFWVSTEMAQSKECNALGFQVSSGWNAPTGVLSGGAYCCARHKPIEMMNGAESSAKAQWDKLKEQWDEDGIPRAKSTLTSPDGPGPQEKGEKKYQIVESVWYSTDPDPDADLSRCTAESF